MADDLYDRDFFAWTQSQAEALRARGAGANALDYERLAEEVEDMGKRDLRECVSGVLVILEHLWKLDASVQERPKAGWRRTVAVQRAALSDVLTASLRQQLEQRLDAMHEDAFGIATAAMEAEEPGAPPLDPARRWSLPEILGQ